MVFLKMQQLLQETKLSTAGDKSVFKSLAVDRHSKTPYSDATQVWSLMNCIVILSFMALYSMSEFVKPTAGGAQKVHGNYDIFACHTLPKFGVVFFASAP